MEDRLRNIIAGVGLLVSLLATPVHAEHAPETKSATAVAETMRAMFDALAVDDRPALDRVLATNFYAFDGGHEMVADDLFKYVKWRHDTGTRYSWSITEPRVHIAGDLATITYKNRGSISDASGTVPMIWLEAAILRLQDGRWRIEFVDSTRTPLAPGTATATIPDSSPKPTYHP